MIPVAAPVLNGRERDLVLAVLESTRLSQGEMVAAFEHAFARWVGVEQAVACCNGTAALHLALLGLGVRPGDEVIVPALTFVATANAVRYCGATPVFVDVEPRHWCIDPEQVAARITKRTRGIIPVHLYGHPADMRPLRDLADQYGLWLLEDAAEAHGARYAGQPAGSIGEAATFSFHGAKILTCGEGGMVTTNDGHMAARMRYLRGQALDTPGSYQHSVVGWNYRLTDLQAAVGLAQLERADWHCGRRVEVASWYATELAQVRQGSIGMQQIASYAVPAFWMMAVTFSTGAERQAAVRALAAADIETRPVFVPLPALTAYLEPKWTREYPRARYFNHCGLVLPTHAHLTREDVSRVCQVIGAAVAVEAA